MNISAVRPYNQAFTSENSDGGYIKSNAGKFIGLGVGAGCLVENIRRKKGISGFLQDARMTYAEILNKAMANAGKTAKFSENELSKELKQMAYVRRTAFTAAVMVGCLLLGAIVDGMVNVAGAKKSQAEHY